MERGLVDVLAHERSLMLEISDQLSFQTLVALERTSKRVWELFNSYGVWKVVFRKLAARLSMYNWELRFSSLEQPVRGGGAQEEVGEQQGEDQVVQGQLGKAGEYEVDPREDHSVGDGQDEKREHKHIQDFNKEGVVVTKDEKEENLSKDRRYKRWLVKLLQLEERWLLKGPVSEVNVEVPPRMEVAAVAADEAGILIGLRPTGRLQLFTRLGKQLLEVNTRQQIASLALTHSLLIAGSLKTDRFYNPSSPVVCLFYRTSGLQAHVISLQGSLTTNVLLAGYSRPHQPKPLGHHRSQPEDELLLICHTPNPTSDVPPFPTSSIYSLPSSSSSSSRSSPSQPFSSRHLYSLSSTTLVTRQCLHPDKSKFLFFSSSFSPLTTTGPLLDSQDRRKSTFGPSVRLLQFSNGLPLSQFPLTSPLPLAQMGFFSPSTVFILHKATYIDSTILVLFDLSGQVKCSLNLPQSLTSDFFSTTSSLLLTLAASNNSLIIVRPGKDEKEDKTAETCLLPWTLSDNMHLLFADPSSIGVQINSSRIKLLNFV